MPLSPRQKKALGRGIAKRTFLGAFHALHGLVLSRGSEYLPPIVTKQEKKKITKALNILNNVRETWGQTSDQLRKEYMNGRT